jgi:hypothetical protein
MSQTNDTAFRCSSHAHPHRQPWRLLGHETLGCEVMYLKILGGLDSSPRYFYSPPQAPISKQCIVMTRELLSLASKVVQGSERQLW